MKKKERNINLDVIRCIAVISVICVHFFLNTGFYNTPVNCVRMYVMTFMRTCFMICVPLFLLLTGYLMNKKTLSKKYYKGITKIIFTYIIVSIMCLIFTKVYKGQSISLWQGVLRTLEFKAAPYAWYIEMYVGLFLLIPFLNLIYNGLKERKEKRILVLTFVIITTLPSIFNIWFKIVPTWWTSIYPITYYFIGAYLSEFKPKIKTLKNIICLVISFAIITVIKIMFSYNENFVWGASWEGLSCVLTSVLTFVLLANINMAKIGKEARNIITKISELSLGIYLVSYIGDTIVYGILNEKVIDVNLRINYFLPAVFSVFIISFGLSYIASIVTLLLNKLEKWSIVKLNERKNKNGAKEKN